MQHRNERELYHGLMEQFAQRLSLGDRLKDSTLRGLSADIRTEVSTYHTAQRGGVELHVVGSGVTAPSAIERIHERTVPELEMFRNKWVIIANQRQPSPMNESSEPVTFYLQELARIYGTPYRPSAPALCDVGVKRFIRNQTGYTAQELDLILFDYYAKEARAAQLLYPDVYAKVMLPNPSVSLEELDIGNLAKELLMGNAEIRNLMTIWTDILGSPNELKKKLGDDAGAIRIVDEMRGHFLDGGMPDRLNGFHRKYVTDWLSSIMSQYEEAKKVLIHTQRSRIEWFTQNSSEG